MDTHPDSKVSSSFSETSSFPQQADYESKALARLDQHVYSLCTPPSGSSPSSVETTERKIARSVSEDFYLGSFEQYTVDAAGYIPPHHTLTRAVWVGQDAQELTATEYTFNPMCYFGRPVTGLILTVGFAWELRVVHNCSCWCGGDDCTAHGQGPGPGIESVVTVNGTEVQKDRIMAVGLCTMEALSDVGLWDASAPAPQAWVRALLCFVHSNQPSLGKGLEWVEACVELCLKELDELAAGLAEAIGETVLPRVLLRIVTSYLSPSKLSSQGKKDKGKKDRKRGEKKK